MMEVTDWLIVAFTFGLLVFTGLLWCTTSRLAKHNVASERAYVTLSHTSPPGLRIDDGSGQMWVTIQVRNAGRTPATVSNLVIKAKALPSETPLPERPDYGREQDEPTAKAFLATDGSFEHTRGLSLSDDNMNEVRIGARTLYVLGYVDYMDQFEQRHRGGYARKYDPSRSGNNLIFVTQSGYNYDRPRKKGEGYD